MKNLAANAKTKKKLSVGIVFVLVLFLCFSITTFAYLYETVKLGNNAIGTGKVTINLNDGAPVITESEFNFEPGMTVVKPFFLENLGTDRVYFRFYFDNVLGTLADVLDVTVKDGDTVLFEGKFHDMTKENFTAAVAAETPLEIGEKRTFTFTLHVPEDVGNLAQNATLAFDLKADAVQVKNNPDRSFN